jgi:uncharacterized protein YgiM (DUF1202 family)
MNTNHALKAAVAAVSAAALLGSAGAASAQSGVVRAVTECEAKGGKQEVGAALGALLGAAVGSNVAKNERKLGAIGGAAAGAAAGSWVGCKMQRDDAAKGLRAYKGEPQGTYVSGGYRLAPYVQPARFSRAGGTMVATANLNVRSAPSVRSGRVGSLQVGQPFEALAYAGDWVLVGHNGVGAGYVNSRYVRPAGQRYAAW